MIITNRLIAQCCPLVVISFALLLSSCSNMPRPVSFPGNESGNVDVPYKKIAFSNAVKFKWNQLNKDSLQHLKHTTTFNMATLPQSQLLISRPVLIPAPIEEKDLEWDTTVYFRVDTIKEESYKPACSVLGIPKQIKGELPRLKDDAGENILLFGAEQGLPNPNVKHIIQDHLGNIWMATEEGVAMFDGTTTYIYTTEQGLQNNYSTFLSEDKLGRIWVVYWGFEGERLDVIDRERGLVEHMPGGDISRIQFDSEGRVYISGDGVAIIDPRKNTLKRITKNEGIPDGWTRGMIMSDNGIIWAAEGKYFIKIDLYKGITKVISDSAFFGSSPDSYTMAKDVNGTVWAGANWNNTIIGFSEKLGKCYRINSKQGLKEGAVKAIQFSKKEEMLVASDGGGLYIINLNQNTIKQVSSEHGLLSKYYQCVLEDNRGRLWLGSRRDGAVVFDNNNFIVHHFGKDQQLLNNAQTVSSISQDSSGNKWIGMENVGLNLIDSTGKTYLFGLQQGLQTLTEFNCLFTDSRKRLWVGNYNALNIIDIPNKKVESIFKGNSKSFQASVQKISEDLNGNIIIGRNGGIFFIENKPNSIKKLDRADLLTFSYYHTVLPVEAGKLWVGTSNGIDIINTSTNEMTHILGGGIDSLAVNQLYRDSNGKIWISSESGLFLVDLRQLNILHFTKVEGLPGENILSVIERQNDYFVSTSSGLCMLQKIENDSGRNNITERWHIYSLSKTLGFNRLDFSGAVLKDHLNNLWWGTGAGLTSLSDIKIDTATPVSSITGIDIMGQQCSFITQKWLLQKENITSIKQSNSFDTGANKNIPLDTHYLFKEQAQWDSITGPNELPVNLVLPYNLNHVTFHFSSLPSTSWEQTRFSYILEGSEKKWSESSNKAEADYQKLAPGNYRLALRSKGVNGKWSQPVYFSFSIEAPWWQKWWAWCIYLVMVIAGLTMFVRYRSKKLRQKNVILELKVEKRTLELKQSLQELKSAQSQLIQSEKMASLGELTAGIAHEIQNPLNFVNNFSEVNKELIDEVEGERSKANGGRDEELETELLSDIKQNNEKIIHHGKRADAIIKGMLQHSQKSSGQKEPTDINKLADEYLRLAYHGLRAKDKSFNADFTTDFDNSIGKTNLIPQDIGRVLLNLFNNAFYAVNERQKTEGEAFKQEVSVQTKKLNGRIEISISDNGNGIPQNIVDKIFQPFFTTKPTGQGTGLGLSLSYDIIKAHGGEIKVETKAEERTTFIIQLPVV